VVEVILESRMVNQEDKPEMRGSAGLVIFLHKQQDQMVDGRRLRGRRREEVLHPEEAQVGRARTGMRRLEETVLVTH
jgi:hypothetical protein